MLTVMYAERHETYELFMCRIRNIILAIKQAESKLMEQDRREGDPFMPNAKAKKKKNKENLPRRLCYNS